MDALRERCVFPMAKETLQEGRGAIDSLDWTISHYITSPTKGENRRESKKEPHFLKRDKIPMH